MEKNNNIQKDDFIFELRRKIREIIQENSKIKINHEYFQKLLDKSRTDLNNRNYIQNIINSIRKSGGLATERQYAVLKKFEKGDSTPYSSKN